MKTIFPIIIFLLIKISMFGQTSTDLPKKVLDEFAICLSSQYEVSTSVKTAFILPYRKEHPNCSMEEIDLLVATIRTKSESKDFAFRVFYNLSKGDESRLYALLKNIYMSTESAITLKNYIIETYKSK